MSRFTAGGVYTTTGKDGRVVVSLIAENTRAAMLAVEEVKDGAIEVELSRHKPKRSLDQNAMLWALLEKMASAYNGRHDTRSVEECYCLVLAEANIKSEYILALPAAEGELKKAFRAVEALGEREVNGKTLTLYRCYIGSSKFTTAEMTELIERVLDRLAEMGVYDSEIEYIKEEIEK